MRKSGSILPQALRSLVSRPATIAYPAGRKDVPTTIRGKLKFDGEKCIGCRLCMRDCPSGAIEIVKIADKRFQARVRLDKCIYCGQCTDTCPRGALATTPEFELAAFSRRELEVDL